MMNTTVNTQKELNNHEIVTLAVYLIGGDTQYVDTEDVAFKANEIAPGRFTWRKYRSQINIENVRTFLSDAKKQKNGGYLRGAGKDVFNGSQKIAVAQIGDASLTDQLGASDTIDADTISPTKTLQKCS